MSHAPESPPASSVQAPVKIDGPAGALALGTGSLPLYAAECSNLMRAAKLLDDEAITWSDGWAVRQKDGSLHWDKDGEWAQIRWMKLRNAAENLRRLAARFVKKANNPDDQRADRAHNPTSSS